MGTRTFVFAFAATAVFAATTYQRPPQAVIDVLNAPATPVPVVSPDRAHLLLVENSRYPSIADLSQPMLRLAGLRINPASNSEHRTTFGIRLTLVDLKPVRSRPVALPAGARIAAVEWSPDGKYFAAVNVGATGVELWLGETEAATLRRVPAVALNTVLRDAVQWMPDGRTLLVQTVPAGRTGAPAAPHVPAGPTVQEGAGKSGPVRTYQDLLQNEHDEALFEYYATAQLAFVDAAAGKVTAYGKAGLFDMVEPAPDGKHVLVSRIHRPFSYLHPVFSFPKDVEVWDLGGKTAYRVASLPLADRVPIEGVRTGPRNVQWRPGQPATLVWTEALDGGNPKEKVPHRDRLLTLRAPFRGEPVQMALMEQRLTSVTWGANGGYLMATDYERDKRWVRTFGLSADKPEEPPRLLFSRNMQDRYQDPGTPVVRSVPGGRPVMMESGPAIYLTGLGATPQGDRPFLTRYDRSTGKTVELFRCGDQEYESVVAVLDDEGTRFVTRRESPAEPPNFYLREAGKSPVALTAFTDPAPQLRSIHKERVVYRRPDGVQLSFTLYLPPGYQKGTRLPTVVWAYPLEYTDADTAGQVSGSTKRFTTFSGPTHLFFLLNGYAILDNAAMPVVGSPETVNNTYIEQVVADAKAAIDKAAEMGVTDPDRVGVGGHSYGAFMTANLLAHCDLFRAGIARSGAYNRTLTPFGFQSERRTFWEAQDVYLRMSPFVFAHKINEPLLLIHGEADNNMGTFPIQSERMYQAVRGNGGTVRLVMLPHESHAYAARESIEHTLWEMLQWFDTHVKNAPPRAVAPAGK